MNTVRVHCKATRGGKACLCLWLLLMGATMPAVWGAPPVDPLPPPEYSFDANSPSVGIGIVGAADLLEPGTTEPTVALPAAALGLLSPADDLDGLSAGNAFVGPYDPFAVLFSVHRATVGTVPPEHALVVAGVPFNVFDQAARGQAAGDQVMSTRLFTRLGGPIGEGGRPISNSVLVRNNYDEGGTDFSAQPYTHAQDYVGGLRVPQDNVDAAARLTRENTSGPFINVYFSLTRTSPSLALLPGGNQPSGAHIFFNAEPGAYPTVLYAAFYELGLTQEDDVDGIIVFDMNANGHFDGPDEVIFSLDPNSPSLGTIPGSSVAGGAANLFVVFPGQPPALYAEAVLLGLDDPRDNIDALDLVPCTDAPVCAAQHGIRALRGDLNCDHVINFADINPFVLALGGEAGYRAQYPWCNWYNGDCNGDGQVNFADINAFVALLNRDG